MVPIKNQFVNRIDGWKCSSPIACIRRQERLGQWNIRPHDGTGLSSSGRRYVLTCEYRQHRLTSMHPTPDAAKAHADDLVASWTARNMREYAGGR